MAHSYGARWLLGDFTPPMVMASWRPKCHQKKCASLAVYGVRNMSYNMPKETITPIRCWNLDISRGTTGRKLRDPRVLRAFDGAILPRTHGDTEPTQQTRGVRCATPRKKNLPPHSKNAR